MKATIKVRCTSRKEVHVPGQKCWVYEFFVLGAHDGGEAKYPNGQAMITVMGGETSFQLGAVCTMEITDD